MKKNNIRGLASLMLLVVTFSFLLTALNHFRNGTAFEPGGVVHLAGLTLCFLIAATVFFAAKGHRLRMALMIAFGGAGGILLTWLDLPTWQEILLVCGVFLVYLTACVLANQRRYSKAVRTLNAAAEAYQKDRDGEAYLQALEQCAQVVPGSTPFQTQDMGTITFQEYLACLKLYILKDMGRTEERRALIEQLRRETKSPGLPAWLDQL